MMRLLRAALGIVLAAMLGCSSTPVAENNPLVGHWYGETDAPDGNGVQRWITERRADGTYTVTFRRYRDGIATGGQRESGRWGYSNGLYSTWTQFMGETATDEKDAHFQDLYVVEDVRNAQMIYKHIRTGRKLRAMRVAEDFRLP